MGVVFCEVCEEIQQMSHLPKPDMANQTPEDTVSIDDISTEEAGVGILKRLNSLSVMTFNSCT